MTKKILKVVKMIMAAAISAAMIAPPVARAARSGRLPGEQRRWALDLQVRMEQPGTERPFEVNLSGDWVSTIVAMRPGEFDAALEVADARSTADSVGHVSAGAREELRRRMARRFWATYREDGALLAVHFYKGVSPSDRNLLQLIATETQLVRSDAGSSEWTAAERDGAGSYLATYQRRAPDEVVKRKLRYTHTDGVAGAPTDGLQLVVDQSELRFRLDLDSEIAGLDGTCRVRMRAAFGDNGQLTATTEIHLANLRKSRAPELIGSLERAVSEVANFAVVTHKTDPEEARAQLDGRLLEGHSTESLLEATMVPGGDPALPDRLAAAFRRRPEATAIALAFLRKNGSHKRITDALAASDSAAAIEALSSLARDRAASASVRVDALTALVPRQHPALETMRLPTALLDDDDIEVRSAARMVSGAVARSGRAAHPAEADGIDAALIKRYRQARDSREVSDLLAALGNSAGASTLSVIKEALRDAREPVRAAAARALRLAPGPEIAGILSATITSDRDPGVRASAILAAGFRRPLGSELGDALLRAASADPVDYVRGDAITLLRRNPDVSPRVAETLATIAQNDAKPDIRRLAGDALASVSRQSRTPLVVSASGQQVR